VLLCGIRSGLGAPEDPKGGECGDGHKQCGDEQEAKCAHDATVAEGMPSRCAACYAPFLTEDTKSAKDCEYIGTRCLHGRC